MNGSSMRRRPAAEVPRITFRSKLRSRSSYYVFGSPNPFAECLAPKFAPEKTELMPDKKTMPTIRKRRTTSTAF